MAAQHRVGDTEIVSRLIEGQFPNYEPVIPTSHTSRAVVDREALLAGTRRASIFARDSANIVKIELGGDNGEATGVAITAHAADIGDNADVVEAAVEGSATAIAFNARYLIDVLGALGAEEAALELSGPLAPGVIRGGRRFRRGRERRGVTRCALCTVMGAVPGDGRLAAR